MKTGAYPADGELVPKAHEGTHASGGADAIDSALAAAAIPTHGAAKHTDITRRMFLPANEGFVAAGASAQGGYYGVAQGGADANEPVVFFSFRVPDDFVSLTSLKAVWYAGVAAGNMYWKLRMMSAADGEVYNTDSNDPAEGTTATGGNNIINVQEPANPLTFAGLAAGDFIGIGFVRTGTHASDTLNATAKLLGLLFTYTANQ